MGKPMKNWIYNMGSDFCCGAQVLVVRVFVVVVVVVVAEEKRNGPGCIWIWIQIGKKRASTVAIQENVVGNFGFLYTCTTHGVVSDCCDEWTVM
jgi:hypothetical protein